MFRVDFQPYMSLASAQARGAEIFAAFRWLEFAVYSSRGLPAEFILADGLSAHNAARALVPARSYS